MLPETIDLYGLLLDPCVIAESRTAREDRWCRIALIRGSGAAICRPLRVGSRPVRVCGMDAPGIDVNRPVHWAWSAVVQELFEHASQAARPATLPMRECVN